LPSLWPFQRWSGDLRTRRQDAVGSACGFSDSGSSFRTALHARRLGVVDRKLQDRVAERDASGWLLKIAWVATRAKQAAPQALVVVR
jgi:hypothetical protein